MNERLKKFDAEEYMKGLRKAVTAGGDPVRITKISPVTGISGIMDTYINGFRCQTEYHWTKDGLDPEGPDSLMSQMVRHDVRLMMEADGFSPEPYSFIAGKADDGLTIYGIMHDIHTEDGIYYSATFCMSLCYKTEDKECASYNPLCNTMFTLHDIRPMTDCEKTTFFDYFADLLDNVYWFTIRQNVRRWRRRK